MTIGATVSLVVAVAENGVIGHDNALPWHLPADLRHFRELTMGHPVLMGRRTHEAIGRPLPGRANFVLSRDPGYRAQGCRVVTSLQAALELVDLASELMVIGGGALYRQALPLASRIYLTRVHANPPGDAYFPDLNPTEWVVDREQHRPADERNEFAVTFSWLSRRDHQSSKLSQS